MVEEEMEQVKEEIKDNKKEEVKQEVKEELKKQVESVKVEQVVPTKEVDKKDTETLNIPISSVSSPVDDPVKNLEVQLENTKLIDYLENVKQEEQRIKDDLLKKENEIKENNLKKEQEQQQKQALVLEEEKEINDALIQENREYQEEVIRLLTDINSDNYKAMLKNDAFNTRTLNEISSIHNDLYVYFGLFIAAFTVLIFSRAWGGQDV